MILKYKELEKENRELYAQLDEKERALQMMTSENERLRNDYAHLKLAKMIEISDQDLNDAKGRVSKLIREIDKCIALLNV